MRKRTIVLVASGLAAVASLVKQQGASVALCLSLLELTFLGGREKLGGVRVESLISY